MMTSQTNSPLRATACLIALFCLSFGTFKLMPTAIKLGVVWHSTSNPMPGVEITLDSGDRFTGTLYRTWDGLVLVDNQGVKHDAESGARSIVLPAVTAKEYSLFNHPKSVFPPLALLFIFMLLAIPLTFALQRLRA